MKSITVDLRQMPQEWLNNFFRYVEKYSNRMKDYNKDPFPPEDPDMKFNTHLDDFSFDPIKYPNNQMWLIFAEHLTHLSFSKVASWHDPVRKTFNTKLVKTAYYTTLQKRFATWLVINKKANIITVYEDGRLEIK